MQRQWIDYTKSLFLEVTPQHTHNLSIILYNHVRVPPLLLFCFYLFIGRSVVGLLSIPDLFVYLWWWEKGFLDGQFLQLQQLQDENNPDFVVEVVSLFFEDSERLLKDLTFALSVLLLSSYHSPSFPSTVHAFIFHAFRILSCPIFIQWWL